jgi:mRNA interferase HigB
MKLGNTRAIFQFGAKHADAKKWLQLWMLEVGEAAWNNSIDIRTRYGSASFLADNVVIFNVCGNKYRLEVQVAYLTQTVFIKRVGTHQDYSKWKH